MKQTWNNKKSQNLFKAFTLLKTREEAANFCRDLMTESEIKELSGRWQVAKELNKGKSQRQVSKETNVSIATVTRVNHWLKKGMKGYKNILNKLEYQKE